MEDAPTRRMRWILPVVILTSLTVVLSSVFSLGFLWAFVIAFAWPMLGLIVTFDDDLPGGWPNPDGKEKPPCVALLGMIGFEILLVWIALQFPMTADFGMRNLIALI